MILEKIAIFILFLGPLVFFHELGHYFFARLFKVRVETFSLGFGPKIFKYKKNETEYAISLIPLGGYLKMFGDNPLAKDEIPVAEQKYSFSHQRKWARFWIVMGGPLANFLMTYCIFFCLLAIGEKFPEIKLGVVSKTSILYQKGMRTGDVIHELDDEKIYNYSDIAFRDDPIQTITVQRRNEERKLNLSMSGKNFLKNLAKHPPLLRSPVVIDDKGERYALSLSSDKVDLKLSFDEMMQMKEIDKLFLFKISGEYDRPIVEESIEKSPVKVLKIPSKVRLEKFLGEHRFRSLDLRVKNVQMGSPAHKSGIESGDILSALSGRPIYSFEQLRSQLQEAKAERVGVTVWRKGAIKKFEIEPEVMKNDGKEMKIIGVYGQASFLAMQTIQSEPKGFFTAMGLAFTRTWDAIVKILQVVKKLVTAEVSLKTIGGPLAIGKFAADSFNTGLSYFFQLMALISVNLGVINLLPIPVLDGGHIMFIVLEILNRGPISQRKMEIAQQLGFAILLILMVGALFNDFSRLF